MSTKLTHKLAALTFISLLQVSGYAFAQDSLFDSIDRGGSGEGMKTFVNPAAETAPRMSPRMQMAPRLAPGAMIQDHPQMLASGMVSGGDQIQTAPQAMVTDPYAGGNFPGGSFGGGHVQPSVAPQAYVAPNRMPVLPESCGFIPKLGFHGRMIPGVGMQVLSVNYGGIAQREGLETGDIIVEINGRRLMYEFDYERALVDAAVYSQGRVSLLVQNIRHRPGCLINPAFVRIYSQLPMRHVHGDPYGVVAAR